MHSPHRQCKPALRYTVYRLRVYCTACPPAKGYSRTGQRAAACLVFLPFFTWDAVFTAARPITTGSLHSDGSTSSSPSSPSAPSPILTPPLPRPSRLPSFRSHPTPSPSPSPSPTCATLSILPMAPLLSILTTSCSLSSTLLYLPSILAIPSLSTSSRFIQLLAAFACNIPINRPYSPHHPLPPLLLPLLPS